MTILNGTFNNTIPYQSGVIDDPNQLHVSAVFEYTTKEYIEGASYIESKLLLLDKVNDVLYLVKAVPRPFVAATVVDDVNSGFIVSLGGGGGSMTAAEIKTALDTLTGANRLGTNSIKEDTDRLFLTDAQSSAITTNSAKNSYPSGDATKVGHISVTQAIDLDTAITGSGTINTVPKLVSGNSIGDSSISDNGTNVLISSRILTVKGSAVYDGIIKIDNSSTTASGIIQIAKNGDVIGAVLADGAVIGNTDSNFSLFAETGNDFRFYTNGSPTLKARIDISGNFSAIGTVTGASFIGSGLSLTGVNTYHSVSDLGTNQTAVSANSARELDVLAGLYNASTTLTFSDVTNLRRCAIQITNTNANVLTFAGITVKFVSDELPSGMSFASNALTFPADTAVVYNVVLEKFNGTVFRGRIELDG